MAYVVPYLFKAVIQHDSRGPHVLLAHTRPTMFYICLVNYLNITTKFHSVIVSKLSTQDKSQHLGKTSLSRN